MLGTVVNAVAVLVGGTLGLLLSKGIADRYRETATFALGLAVVYIGLDSAAQTRNPVIMIASLVIGGLLGEWLRLDERLHRFAAGLEKLFGASAGRFSEAFVTSTLVYCVGAMGIMGAIQSGLTGDHATLYAKSMLDGISSVFFASALGAGVLLSALPVFLYQGSITLGASWAAAWLTPPMQAEMNAVGGILILAIGLGILDIKRVRVANLLPAIFLAVIFAAFV
ncbi:MAG: DUF554 domain-containing protein [Bacillota bacterium]|jgi:uncharacterized membrane protein YqgA involved in biofilm formation